MLIVFYMFLALFAIIGAMRGWAKEILVTFSVILALALITVLEELLPVVGPMLKGNLSLQYWVRMAILLGMTFFGYQSPKITRLAKGSERKDRIQDTLLGLILGMVSGFFVAGSFWWFSNAAGYPVLTEYIVAPAVTQPGGETTLRVLSLLPPAWLMKQPNIYIAVVLAFIFVIVVFV
jgi:hypothetical protein